MPPPQLIYMPFYCRHLPHLSETDRPVFLTWRLHDSLPPNRDFSKGALTSEQAFEAMDRLLDETRTGRSTCGNRPSPE